MNDPLLGGINDPLLGGINDPLLGECTMEWMDFGNENFHLFVQLKDIKNKLTFNWLFII